jgi:uncharacterized protein YjbI with pentapeptide repeats
LAYHVCSTLFSESCLHNCFSSIALQKRVGEFGSDFRKASFGPNCVYISFGDSQFETHLQQHDFRQADLNDAYWKSPFWKSCVLNKFFLWFRPESCLDLLHIFSRLGNHRSAFQTFVFGKVVFENRVLIKLFLAEASFLYCSLTTAFWFYSLVTTFAQEGSDFPFLAWTSSLGFSWLPHHFTISFMFLLSLPPFYLVTASVRINCNFNVFQTQIGEFPHFEFEGDY